MNPWILGHPSIPAERHYLLNGVLVGSGVDDIHLPPEVVGSNGAWTQSIAGLLPTGRTSIARWLNVLSRTSRSSFSRDCEETTMCTSGPQLDLGLPTFSPISNCQLSIKQDLAAIRAKSR
jgi:hypothetical protein